MQSDDDCLCVIHNEAAMLKDVHAWLTAEDGVVLKQVSTAGCMTSAASATTVRLTRIQVANARNNVILTSFRVGGLARHVPATYVAHHTLSSVERPLSRHKRRCERLAASSLMSLTPHVADTPRQHLRNGIKSMTVTATRHANLTDAISSSTLRDWSQLQ